MKIGLDLPDWVDERNIRILAGVELAAVKNHADSFFRVKVGRCNMCGDCCTGLKNHVYPTINGECVHLKPPDEQGRRECGIPLYKSRVCENDPRPLKHERCSITYKIVQCK